MKCQVYRTKILILTEKPLAVRRVTSRIKFCRWRLSTKRHVNSGRTPAPAPGPAASGRAAWSRSWHTSCRSVHLHVIYSFFLYPVWRPHLLTSSRTVLLIRNDFFLSNPYSALTLYLFGFGYGFLMTCWISNFTYFFFSSKKSVSTPEDQNGTVIV